MDKDYINLSLTYEDAAVSEDGNLYSIKVTAVGLNVTPYIFVYQYVPGIGEVFRNIASVHDIEELPEESRNANSYYTGFYRKNNMILLDNTSDELLINKNKITQCVEDIVENIRITNFYKLYEEHLSKLYKVRFFIPDKTINPENQHNYPIRVVIESETNDTYIFRYENNIDYGYFVFNGVINSNQFKLINKDSGSDLFRTNEIELYCRNKEDIQLVIDVIKQQIECLEKQIENEEELYRNTIHSSFIGDGLTFIARDNSEVIEINKIDYDGNLYDISDVSNYDIVNSEEPMVEAATIKEQRYDVKTIVELTSLPAGTLADDINSVVTNNDVSLNGWLDISIYETFDNTVINQKPELQQIINDGYTPVLFYNVNEDSEYTDAISVSGNVVVDNVAILVDGRPNPNVIYKSGYIFWCTDEIIDFSAEGYYVIDTPWGYRDPNVSDYIDRTNTGTRLKSIKIII